MAGRPPTGSVGPTGWQAVGVALVAGAGLGWSLFTALDAFGAPLPQLPVAVTLLIAVLAALIGAQAAVASAWAGRRGRGPVDPGNLTLVVKTVCAPPSTTISRRPLSQGRRDRDCGADSATRCVEEPGVHCGHDRNSALRR